MTISPEGQASVPLAVSGANGGGSVVLVHGLASAGRSWAGFGAALPAGVGWAAIDLAGHGRASTEAPYSFGGMATEVGRLCASLPGPVTLIGHSLGGAVALLTGTGLFGARIDRVVAIGTKVRWTEHELDRAAAVAAKPAKLFASRDEARDFWQLVAGVPVGGALDPALEDDVLRADGDAWRLAYDPAAAALGAAPVQALIDLNQGEVQLVRGERDPLVSAEDIALANTLPGITVPGCGHSPHVERPALLAGLLGYPGGAGHESMNDRHDKDESTL